jgi:putative ABC transport system substrate-binding protein
MSSAGWSDARGLIAYTTSIMDAAARMLGYVDRRLKGARPSELPREVITRRELVINLRTARALEITISPEVLKRADHVIEREDGRGVIPA